MPVRRTRHERVALQLGYDLSRTFAMCAVVGSSGSLLTDRYGDEIDSADLVLRFNNAPSSAYEPIVGARTDGVPACCFPMYDIRVSVIGGSGVSRAAAVCSPAHLALEHLSKNCTRELALTPVRLPQTTVIHANETCILYSCY